MPVKVNARRAVEALRSGVPSRDAVAALGTAQGEAEDRVADLLGRLSWPSRGTAGRQRGVLLGGGFGSGKSHLLEHLTAGALDAGWCVSRVVVSKETPLHDPSKVLRAAAESATVTGSLPGEALAEAAAELDADSAAYAELLLWTASPRGGLDERFAATLPLYVKLRDVDDQAAGTIVRFWAGDPLKVADLRRWLREAGEPRPVLHPVPVKDLARQRLRFAARLLAATGRAGWLLLFDEAELVGRYALMSRARSYAELAWWLSGETEDGDVPLASVIAMTDDFEAAVLSGKDDRSVVPRRLRDKQTPDADILAGRAEAGMRLIEREMVRLAPPDDAELQRTYHRLRELHGEAFEWDPPDVPGLERLGANRMRQYVRAWINEWDLVRLDPEFTPDSVVVPVELDYREEPELGSEHPTS